MAERTPRQIILRALQNVGRDEELIPYLFNAVNSIDTVAVAITIATNVPERFAFIKEMYPSITLKQQAEPDTQTLFFSECDKDGITFVNPLHYTFSFFPKNPSGCRSNITVGLGEKENGVFVQKVDVNTLVSNPLQMYPYFLCLTDRLESIHAFLEIVGGSLRKNHANMIDIFLPYASYPLLSSLVYSKQILSVFGTIEVHDDTTNSVTTVTMSKRGRTLRIRSLPGVVTPALVRFSDDHILIDYKEPVYQSILDTIENFPEKIIWTQIDSNPFFQRLKMYTLNKKVKKMTCFQFKKKFPVLDLNLLIKLGTFLPDLQDIMKILCEKEKWYKKISKLIEIK